MELRLSEQQLLVYLSILQSDQIHLALLKEKHNQGSAWTQLLLFALILKLNKLLNDLNK